MGGLQDPAGTRCQVIGVPIDLIDYDTALCQIKQWHVTGRREYVVMATAADIELSRAQGLEQVFWRAGLSLPDGVAVILAARLMGYTTRGRVTGPDLMIKVCDMGRDLGYRHFFYGGTEDILTRLVKRLAGQLNGIKIAGHFCPPFRSLSATEDEHVVDMINRACADVIWVGLGGTKQIRWMAEHHGRIRATAMIGVGAAFNFHSNTISRAPIWMRNAGMEWAYRMAREPAKILPRTRHTLLFVAHAMIHAVRHRLAGCSKPEMTSAGRYL